MAKLKKVLIMAGGTGGHVFPGLAVAKRLRSAGIEVHWMGTAKGLEAKLVPDAGIPLHFITISGVRGKSFKDVLMAPARLSLAVRQALSIIRKLKPDVVLGMGGFVSGPGGIASWLLRCPLVIHEQNAKPGTTNKWLSRVAKKVLEGFPGTFLKRKNVETSGNPVRDEINQLLAPEQRFSNHTLPLHLLVIGGSLGALAINELLPSALVKLPNPQLIQVWHQTGEKNFEQTIKAYKDVETLTEIKQNTLVVDVVPFIKEMDKAYAWADLVLCRAGALTVSELCAAGLGAIFIPYPHAIDDHQTANANFMVRNKAALLVQQSDVTSGKLAKILQEFIESPERCRAMAEAAYALRQTDATDKVLTICEEICL